MLYLQKNLLESATDSVLPTLVCVRFALIYVCVLETAYAMCVPVPLEVGRESIRFLGAGVTRS